MSVYIKGMEMPKSCFECPMRWKVDPDTIKCLATGERFEETFAGTIETRNRGNCPLIPVPDHGRLGDLDKLAEEIHERWEAYPADAFCEDFLDELPTIIPANKEDGE